MLQNVHMFSVLEKYFKKIEIEAKIHAHDKAGFFGCHIKRENMQLSCNIGKSANNPSRISQIFCVSPFWGVLILRLFININLF